MIKSKFRRKGEKTIIFNGVVTKCPLLQDADGHMFLKLPNGKLQVYSVSSENMTLKAFLSDIVRIIAVILLATFTFGFAFGSL